MAYRRWMVTFLASTLAATLACGDETDELQRSLESRRSQTASRSERRAPIPRDSVVAVRVQRMKEGLDLDDAQVKQVTEILEGDREKLRQLNKALQIKTRPDLRDKARELQTQMREAQAAGDDERLKQLQEQFQKEYLDEIGNFRKPIRQQMNQIRSGETARTAIRGVLREDQLEVWDTRAQEFIPTPTQFRTDQPSALVLRANVDGLDLTPEQKVRIDELFEAYEAGKPEAEKQRFGYVIHLKQLYDDVDGVLTEEQKSQMATN